LGIGLVGGNRLEHPPPALAKHIATSKANFTLASSSTFRMRWLCCAHRQLSGKSFSARELTMHVDLDIATFYPGILSSP
jgi:hypothetical protein